MVTGANAFSRKILIRAGRNLTETQETKVVDLQEKETGGKEARACGHEAARNGAPHAHPQEYWVTASQRCEIEQLGQLRALLPV